MNIVVKRAPHMAPLIEAFPASELSERIVYKPDGQRRKSQDKLKDCALKELLQYDCDLQGPQNSPQSKVVCKPILRLFRKSVAWLACILSFEFLANTCFRCADGLTVETTAWEDKYDS